MKEKIRDVLKEQLYAIDLNRLPSFVIVDQFMSATEAYDMDGDFRRVVDVVTDNVFSVISKD